ncbi:hypothetical protein O0L34_g10024 [Tuta absoluta]|nr:hypothetical protein O0L34_g10024 [Tuta absoluta]
MAQVPVFLAHYYPHLGRFHEWMLRFKVYEGDDELVVWWLEKYVVNLYWVTGLCIGAGFYTILNKKAQHWPEQLQTAILSLIGLTCIAYLMTTILRMIIYHNYGMLRYNGLIMELQQLLKFKRVPQRLRHKIQLYLNYRFNGKYFNKDSILATLNVQIKHEINMYYCKNLLVNVPLFHDMPIALINTIIFSLTQVLYMPGEVIVQHGHPGSSLYLIASGTVAIVDSSGMEVGHLTDGAFFGETTVVNPGLPRAATIIALEITEIYK